MWVKQLIHINVISYLVRVDEIFLADGAIIFSSSQLQNIPDIGTSTHDLKCREATHNLSNVNTVYSFTGVNPAKRYCPTNTLLAKG